MHPEIAFLLLLTGLALIARKPGQRAAPPKKGLARRASACGEPTVEGGAPRLVSFRRLLR